MELLKIMWTNSLNMKEPVSLRKAAGDIFREMNLMQEFSWNPESKIVA